MEHSTLKKFKETFVDTNFENVSDYRCIVIQEEDEVSYGSQKDINLEYCIEHKIPTYDLKRSGGCIVHCKGAINWAEITNNSNQDNFTNHNFMAKFAEYLKNKGLNAIRDKNDVLVDGFKVAGGCAINLPPDYKRTFSAVQISWKCNVELIENICTKPMTKVPKGLCEYGIAQEEIIEFIENYFTK